MDISSFSFGFCFTVLLFDANTFKVSVFLMNLSVHLYVTATDYIWLFSPSSTLTYAYNHFCFFWVNEYTYTISFFHCPFKVRVSVSLRFVLYAPNFSIISIYLLLSYFKHFLCIPLEVHQCSISASDVKCTLKSKVRVLLTILNT